MLGWAVTEPVWAHLDEFTEATGIEVVLNEMPFADLRTKQTLEGESGTGAYDVLQIYDSAMPILYKYCIPLDDYLAEEEGSVEDWSAARFPSVTSMVTYENSIYIDPFMGGCQIGYYRKDLFEDPEEQANFKEEYGYDLQPPTTKQQLVDIAKFFTRDDMWGLALPGKGDHGFGIFEMQMFDAGANFTDENYKLIWPDNREKLIGIAKYNQDFVQTHKVTPEGCVSYEMPGMVEEYFGGNAAMCVSWLHDFWKSTMDPDIVSKIGETGTFVFPSDTEYKGGYIGWWGWGISKDSANKDAAREFVKWFNSDETQKIMLSEGGASFLPPKLDVAEYGSEQGFVPPATAEAGETALIFIFFDQLDLLRQACRPLHEELLTGSLTPEEFVDGAIAVMTEILEEAGIEQ